ncbi:hypothetical protein ACVDFE_32510 [Lentzea chajnantorensis]
MNRAAPALLLALLLALLPAQREHQDLGDRHLPSRVSVSHGAAATPAAPDTGWAWRPAAVSGTGEPPTQRDDVDCGTTTSTTPATPSCRAPPRASACL